MISSLLPAVPSESRPWLPYGVLLSAMVLTGVATHHFISNARQKDARRFELAAQELKDEAEWRLAAPISLLRGGIGLLAAQRWVTRAEFQAYFAQLDIPQHYPGVESIGFSVRTTPKDKPVLVNLLDQQGITNFTFRPDYEREEYHSVIYLEPMEAVQQKLIGQDMYLQASLKAAMEQARDEAAVAATGPVLLDEGAEAKAQPGFLMFFPVYRTVAVPDTVMARSARLYGFLFARIQMNQFMPELFGAPKNSPLDVEVYEGREALPDKLLYRSAESAAGRGRQPRFQMSSPMEVAGRTWTLAFKSRQDAEFSTSSAVLALIPLSGALLSLVLFYLTLSQEKGRQAAERHAAQLRVSESALRQSQDALREVEQRYRRLVESSPMAILIQSDGAIVFLNPAAVKLFGGTSKEDFLGRPVLDLVHPDLHETVRERMNILAAELQPVPIMEQKLRRLDGSVFYGEVASAPLVFEGKAGAQVVLSDVSARKQIQRERDRFFNLSLDVFCIASFDGIMQRVNPAVEQVFGYTVDEALASPFWKYIHPDDLESTMARVQELARGRDIVAFENRIRCKDGTYRWMLWNAAPIPEEKLFYAAGRDMTERQNLEAQLRQSQKMESVGLLAGGIAHDFNNILTIIHGNATLLREHPYEDADMAESVAQILSASERATKLTRQLLMFGRRQLMQPRTLDLNEVVRHMSHLLLPMIGEDVTAQFDYAPEPLLIKGDSGMIEQVLMNLAINSREAMPKGGRLVMSTEVITLDGAGAVRRPELRPGRYVCLTVRDTGRGIPAGNLPRIFEPFFTTKEVSKGSGLGLATVYGIMQQHQGWIEVESTEHEGTTFRLFFPCTEESMPALDIGFASENVQGGQETLLVVEDEAAVRWLVGAVLRRYGYEVLEAGTGKEALKVWQKHRERIQLLLTDVVMPEGMSGRDLAERLQESNPALKVIYTSGYGADMVGKDFVLQEGVHFLQKPYDPSKLARTVRACLDEE